MRAGTSRAAAMARAVKEEPAIEITESAVDEEVEDDQDEDGGTTRCVCGKPDDEAPGSFYIQCDICKAWQHGPCMGLESEDSCPETYYCEECRPDLHPELIKRLTKAKAAAPAHHRTLSNGQSKGKEKEMEPQQETPAELPKTRRSASTDAKHVHIDEPSTSRAGLTRKEAAAQALGQSANRRRSTMNSRDAAFEEQLAQAMRLSKVAAGIRDSSPATSLRSGNQQKEGAAEDQDEDQRTSNEGEDTSEPRQLPKGKVAGVKRKRTEDISDHLSKRSRSGSASQHSASAVDDAAAVSPDPEFLAPPPPRKPKSGGFKGTRRGGLSKANMRDVDDDSHKHPNQYTYRGKNAAPNSNAGQRARLSPQKRAAMERGNRAALGDGSQPIGRLNWALPEYLLHLKHLLPANNPTPIAVPHSDPLGSADVADAPLKTVNELPTRIRYPAKRMSMQEMRKRSKSMIDYLARVQTDMAERARRSQMLSQLKTPDTSPSSSVTSSNSSDHTASMGGMEGLSRDLINFQTSFFGRSGLANSFTLEAD